MNRLGWILIGLAGSLAVAEDASFYVVACYRCGMAACHSDGGRVRGPAERRGGTDAVRADLAGVVQQALEPAHVTVWTSRPG